MPPGSSSVSPGTSRREFVGLAARALSGGALAGTAVPLLGSCASSLHAGPAGYSALADVSGLTADVQSLVIAAPGPDGAPILVVRRSSDRFTALSMRCTHEGCPVSPPAGGIITCPCHGSQFDLEGKVLRGPAKFPLARYATKYNPRENSLGVRSP